MTNTKTPVKPNAFLAENQAFQNKLRFVIILDGTDFDGMMNYGVVVLRSDESAFILDSMRTHVAYNDNNVVLTAEFFNLEETIEMFDTDDGLLLERPIDFNQSLATMFSGKVEAFTNLHFTTTSGEDEAQLQRNIDRVTAMRLIHLEGAIAPINVVHNESI